MDARRPKGDGNEDRQRAIAEILHIRALTILCLAAALHLAAETMLLVQTMVDKSLARSFAVLELVAAVALGLLAWLIATAEVAGPLLSSFSLFLF